MAPQQPPAKNSESTCLERRWTSGSINDSCGRLLPRGQGSSSAGRGVLPGYPDQLRRRSLTEDTHSSTCPRESQLRSLHSQINQNKNVRLFFFFLSTESFLKNVRNREKKCPKLQTPRDLSSPSSLLWRVVHFLLPLPHHKDSPGSG